MSKLSGARKMEENPQSEKGETQGLCSSCKGASTCTYISSFGTPILECDEFEGIAPPPSEKTDALRSSLAGAQHLPGLTQEDLAPLRGLCATCELKDTCDYPKPEGGVWHCDEYR